MVFQSVFITGGTGFVGRNLIPELARRGHRVRAIARPKSVTNLPKDAQAFVGDVTRAESYFRFMGDADTFVHLAGVSHPNPAKAAEFRRVDLESTRQAVNAAVRAGIKNFVYVSVAQPSPVMAAYVAVRQECEQIISMSGLKASILRPFYILGPGRQWPRLLQPFFLIAERLPSLGPAARRLSFVNVKQMTGALVSAVENPPRDVRIWTAADIKEAGERIASQMALA